MSALFSFPRLMAIITKESIQMRRDRITFAMQLTFFFFLPSLLLSGFMFPYRGMPGWAQALREIFPLTHFLRIIRAVMLKGADLEGVASPLLALMASSWRSWCWRWRVSAARSTEPSTTVRAVWHRAL